MYMPISSGAASISINQQAQSSRTPGFILAAGELDWPFEASMMPKVLPGKRSDDGAGAIHTRLNHALIIICARQRPTEKHAVLSSR